MTVSELPATTSSRRERVPTGIPGLDEILSGGLVANRTYLLTGPPGGGKTTLGWHFLTAASGAERSLFITFGESESDLRANAASVGIDTRAVAFCDLSPSSDLFAQIQSYDIFSASEVELEPTTKRIIDSVETTRPTRVFIDSMTALRYLAKDQANFRRQTLSFLRYLQQRGACIVMTSEGSVEAPDDDLRFLADGVIEVAPYGRGRSLTVIKLRGSDYRPGAHTLVLDAVGATVYPRLMPAAHAAAFVAEPLAWGDAALDRMSAGGLERATVTLVTGPSGVGKTTIGMQFMKEAAHRGERSAVYTFDERVATILERCENVGIPAREMVEVGSLSVFAVEALRFSPDEFANIVRRDVEENATRIVMIDSISGYKLSVSGEDLAERLHALCRYLQNVGVTVILVHESLSLTDVRISDVGISYLADNVIVMRYIERAANGHAQLGRAIGVIKKRLSDFECTLRAFEFTPAGVRIGEPLDHLAGLLGPRDFEAPAR